MISPFSLSLVTQLHIRLCQEKSSKVETPHLLVRLSGSEGFSVDVDDGLLPQVDPVDELLVAVLLLDRLQALVEPLQGRLAGAETGESGQLEK